MSHQILIIEDNPDDREMLLHYLGKHRSMLGPVDIIEAHCLREAEQSISDRDIACVVADLTLPDAQGLDILTAIQQQSANTPVIILSGLSDEDLMGTALACGALAYFLKDDALSDAELVQTLAQTLHRRNE